MNTPCPPSRKATTGCSPSPMRTSLRFYQWGATGSEGNWNKEKAPDIYIGRSLLTSFRNVASEESSESSATVSTQSSRSSAASDYVWKELTRVAGTQFEIGDKPINRAASKDWDRIRASAVSGNFDDVPSDVFVRCYHQLRSIRQRQPSTSCYGAILSRFLGQNWDWQKSSCMGRSGHGGLS